MIDIVKADERHLTTVPDLRMEMLSVVNGVSVEQLDKGLARRMMAALIEDAKQRRATHISLDATQSGKPLYRSLGFEISTEAMGINLP